MKRLDHGKNLLHFFNALGRANPELALRILDALGLDLFDLDYRVVSLLSPLKFLIQEVEHCKVETPQIISTRQVDIIVRVQTRKRDSAAEVCVAPLGHGLTLTVKMLLGEAEVDDVDLAIISV